MNDIMSCIVISCWVLNGLFWFFIMMGDFKNKRGEK